MESYIQLTPLNNYLSNCVIKLYQVIGPTTHGKVSGVTYFKAYKNAQHHLVPMSPVLTSLSMKWYMVS